MTIARSVADVLRNHVTLEYEAIDRMNLNVYVPHLQTVGWGICGFTMASGLLRRRLSRQ
jgi:hypothetical protein